MTDLTTFNYLSKSVRVVELDDRPWFVAADVCVALGAYVGPRSGKPNVTMAIQKLDADECRFNRIEFTDRLGRNHASKVMLISESGLNKLVMRSDKPEAKEFQNWIAREVLPSIRKDGMYVAGEEKVKTGGRNSLRFSAGVQRQTCAEPFRWTSPTAPISGSGPSIQTRKGLSIARITQKVSLGFEGGYRPARSTVICLR